jgi:4-carboxymuconolactone decarboxylase
VILRVPDLVVPSLQMRLHNQKNSALSPRLTEFAILIAARQWTNNYEWNAHATLADRAGLGQPVIAAVADGRRPDRMTDDEATVLRFLHRNIAQSKRQRSDLCPDAGEVRRARRG